MGYCILTLNRSKYYLSNIIFRHYYSDEHINLDFVQKFTEDEFKTHQDAVLTFYNQSLEATHAESRKMEDAYEFACLNRLGACRDENDLRAFSTMYKKYRLKDWLGNLSSLFTTILV